MEARGRSAALPTWRIRGATCTTVGYDSDGNGTVIHTTIAVTVE